MSVSIRLENERQILQGIDQLERALGREMADGADRAVDKIFAESQRRVPVVSGELKASGYKKKATARKGVLGASVAAELGYTADHATSVEYRPGGRGARFLRGSVDKHAGGADELNAALDRALRLVK